MIWPRLTVFAEEPEPATDVAVEVGKVVKTTLHRYVMAYGAVEPEPATGGKPPASSRIATPIASLVTQIHCEEGQRVEKGAPLFQLDTRAADALVARAEVAVEFARKNFARKQQLAPAENVSRKLYDEAEQMLQAARKDLLNAQTQRELLRIAAPLSGTIVAVYAKVGEAVGLNTVLADLIDLDRLVVAIHVPSQEAVGLRRGQRVEISAGSLSAGGIQNTTATQRGSLSFIGPQVEPRTDTVLARVSLTKGGPLRPGQFVSVRVVVEDRPERLAVPVESVVRREGISVIAVVEGDRAKQMPIKTGLRDGNLIEVEGGGLREGLRIVTHGAYGLPPETRIRVVK
jgi:membrane fusion protein (multidrug efflux system)